MRKPPKPKPGEPIRSQPCYWLKTEGGNWIPGAPPVGEECVAIRYANGWIYDKILESLTGAPWRHIND